jgi:hypothetical protein
VQKLALEALQEIRLNTAGKPLIRWSLWEKNKKKFEPCFDWGYLKQLLARVAISYKKQIKVV